MFTKEICEYIRECLHVSSDENTIEPLLLTDGKSGASVYRMKILSQRERLSGTYVLKQIDTKSRWYSARNNEAEKSQRIFEKANPFSLRLVKLVDERIFEDKHVLIYRQANESVLNTASLDNLKTSEQSNYLRLISFELLKLFNEGVATHKNAADFYENLLSYRLNADSLQRKTQCIVEDMEKPAVAIGGNVYPNPYYYLLNRKMWQIKITTLFFKKNVHGDLHRRNILCAKDFKKADDLRYSIIDYDSFTDEGYLFFDHAYLELSIYLDESTNNDLRQWFEDINPLICTSVLSDAGGEPDNKFLYLRNAICKGIDDWASENFTGLKDDVTVQFGMARVAAGFNYFCKKAILDAALLAKIYLYIGICLKQLFDIIGFDWDRDNISPLVRSPLIDDKTELLWENCVRFSPNYINILLTDFSYSAVEYKQLLSLYHIDWSLIIDVMDKQPPDEYNTMIEKYAENSRPLIMPNLLEETDVEYMPNSCTWLVVRKTDEERSYGQLWGKY